MNKLKFSIIIAFIAGFLLILAACPFGAESRLADAGDEKATATPGENPETPTPDPEPTEQPLTETGDQCFNNLDDDGDGYVDADDPDCDTGSSMLVEDCYNSVDDDLDSYVDCDDPDCAGIAECQ